jgi:hypothetical protein
LVVTIGESAFNNFTNLITITLSETIQSIGENAFENCISLETIIIPNGVTSIGNNTFANCESLESIILPASIVSIGNGAFQESGLTTITLPETLQSIGENAFNGSVSLETIIIPNGVTSIGNNTFANCESLESIILPASLVSIGNGAFQESGLTTITLPETLQSIGENAFNGSVNLETITIPDLVTSIGNGTFNGCINLESIILLATVQSIGNSAFSESGLTSITLPASFQRIGNYAFYNCENLLTTTFDLTREFGMRTIGSSIGDYAFANSGITTITIPDGVTSIGNGAFSECSNLAIVEIMNQANITALGSNVFTGIPANSRVIFYNVINYTNLSVNGKLIADYFNSNNRIFSSVPVITTTPAIGNIGTSVNINTFVGSNSSGLLTYVSGNTFIANVIGNILYFNNIGTMTITITQGASGNYLAGSSSFQVTVNEIGPTIKPSFTFTEQTSSSDRMFELKNKTQYAYFKNNNSNNINACNLPVKNSSYEYKNDIRKGNDLCKK